MQGPTLQDLKVNMSNRAQLVNGEWYHLILRSVGDTTIFVDEEDRYRGIFSIYEFNNSNAVNIWVRRQQRKAEKAIELLLGPTSQSLELPQDKRDKLLEIGAFCFMPNHIHLLARQIQDNGISRFMQKAGTGYAAYFNKKYHRKGHLFNRFKAVYIKDDIQLKNVFVYIHANPLSLIEPGWKENGIVNQKKAIEFLETQYRWSSFFDYLYKKNFPTVTTRDFMLEIMSGNLGCRDSVRDWIKYKNGVDFILE